MADSDLFFSNDTVYLCQNTSSGTYMLLKGNTLKIYLIYKPLFIIGGTVGVWII